MNQETYTAAFDEDDEMSDSRFKTCDAYCIPDCFQKTNLYVSTDLRHGPLNNEFFCLSVSYS